MSDHGTFRRGLWLHPLTIMGTALLIRLIWSACVPVDPVSDGVLYDAFARSMATGHGYAFADGTLTEYWPVGTSAVYALLYKLFGLRPIVVAVFQSLLGAAIVGMTWRIARQAFNENVAALAAWLTAIWPLLIEFTTILASELLFIALVLLSINIWISSRLSPVVRTVFWAACIAAATYVRPTAWPLLLIFPSLRWCFDRDFLKLLKTITLGILTAALLFAPWAYRSELLFGRPVLVSANGGVNLWMGNNPNSSGGYMDLPDREFRNEVDRDRYYGQEAVHYILSHPADYARLAVMRTITTYDRETIGVVWNERGLSSRYGSTTLAVLKGFSSAYWWAMLILGCAGVAQLLRRDKMERVWPLLAGFAYFLVFPILTVAMDRYHVPIDPMLAIFASHRIVSSVRGKAIWRVGLSSMQRY